MPPHDREKLNRIEELKTKLFNRDYQTKIEHRESFPHFQKKNVVDFWERPEDSGEDLKENFFMKTSLFKKFFIFSIMFFILSLGYASYIFFIRGNTVSNDNINISVLSNAFTSGGEEYPLLLEIENRNNSSLQLADLIIEYPKNGESSLSEDNEHIRISLGTIPAGGIKNENIKTVLFGEQGSVSPIKISLEYRVEGSNAIFVKEKLFEVSINSTPINISVEAPNEINSNQDINLNIKTTLNSSKSVSKMLLKVDYPIGFQFVKAVPAPSSANNIWDLGDLAPGAERSISVTGKMIDVSNGEEKVFRVWSGSQSLTDKNLIGVVFNSLEHIVLVKQSAVEAKLTINGVSNREYSIDTKTAIQGQIEWKNNLDTKINDLRISVKISGNAVNRKTISATQGFYDSLKDTIIWDKNYQNDFAEVNSGDYGSVSFSLSPLSLFSASLGLMSSPSINLDVTITGKQAEDGGLVKELSNSESKTIKIISDVGFSTKALYYSGVFVNNGPIPPKVEQKTTYTIVWSLSNTSNDISKAQVRSSIPPYVNFIGPFLPASEDLVYNSSTREIIWNIGKISKGTGITGADKKVSFQVEFSPSLSQLGKTPTIVNDAFLTGHDDFANVDVRVNKTPLDIRLINDPNFPTGGDRVVE